MRAGRKEEGDDPSISGGGSQLDGGLGKTRWQSNEAGILDLSIQEVLAMSNQPNGE